MKQITIWELLPLLRKGWVAMDAGGTWCWYKRKPFINESDGFWRVNIINYKDRYYNLCDIRFIKKIKRYKGNWQNSLIKV